MAKKANKTSARKVAASNGPVIEELTFEDIADLMTGDFEMQLARGVVVVTPEDIDDEAAEQLERIKKICGELLQDYERADDSDDDDEETADPEELEDDDSFDEEDEDDEDVGEEDYDDEDSDEEPEGEDE